jgi:hypothetical protein
MGRAGHGVADQRRSRLSARPGYSGRTRTKPRQQVHQRRERSEILRDGGHRESIHDTVGRLNASAGDKVAGRAAEAKVSPRRDLILRSAAAEYVVVGAGPAGLTVARLLAFKGRRVLVADAGVPAANRLELLAPSSLRTVAAIGIESLLHDPAIAQPCLGIRRKRGASDYEYEDFLRHPYRVGYVVNRARFDERLHRDAAAAGVEFCRARVIGIAPDGDGLRVRPTEGPPTLLPYTGTVIDATGRAAMIARGEVRA